MESIESLRVPFSIYFIIAILFGVCLGVDSNYLTAFSCVFFCFYVLVDDSRHRLRLLISSIILGLAFMLIFLWPISHGNAAISFFAVSLVGVFTALNLLAAYHKSDSLRPPYALFFDEVWNNFIVIILVLVFIGFVELFFYILSSLSGYIGLTGLKHFLQYEFVSLFVLGFSTIVGLYLVRTFSQTLYYLRFVFIFFGRLFFLGLTALALLFLVGWAVQGFSVRHFKLGSIDFTYLLSWFSVLGLIFLNTAYPYEVRDVKFTKLRRYCIMLYVVLGFVMASLAVVTYFVFQHAEAARYTVHYPMFNSANIFDYFVNGLIWIYYLGYLITLIIKRRDFLKTSFPRVNIILAWVFIVALLLINNPLVYHFVKVPSQPLYKTLKHQD